jgi:protein-disulfide isomerase
METEPETKPASPTPVLLEKFATPIAILLGLIIIAGAIMYGRGGLPAKEPGPVAVDATKVNDDTSPTIGEKNAPVVMAVWFDYQCPFCKRFELEAMSQLYENYVKTGKLRVILKDFQFLGPDSDTAALFGRAVWEAYPERFYEWYVAMAENQDEEHGGFGDLPSIVAMTKGLGGMDTDRIQKLMTDKGAEYQAAIEADRAEGAALGISGTPSMIIGKTLLSGAQPYAKVSGLVDAELK